MTSEPRERSRSGAPWLAPIALLVGIGVLVLLLALSSDPTVQDWWYVAGTLLPGCVALVAWRLRMNDVASAWRWLAVGLMLSGVGDLLYQFSAEIGGGPLKISIVDVAWLASYLALGFGLLELLRRDDRRWLPDVDVLLDVGTVVTLTLLVVWQSSLAETVTDSTVSLGVRMVLATYPVLDAVLLALCVRLLISRRSRTPAVALLLLGFGMWLAADFGEMGETDATVLVDAGWMFGAGCMGAAIVLMCGAPRQPEPRSLSRHEMGAWRLAFSITAMTVPVAIENSAQHGARPLGTALVYSTTVLLGLLMFARAYRLLREMRIAESRVRSSEAYYRAIAANSSDAVIVVDAQGLVISDSDNLGALVGSDLDSAVGARLMEIAWLANPGDARDLFEEALRAPGETMELEVRLHHRTDEAHWLSARVVNLLDDPAIGGVVITLHDITDRKLAEESLEHQAFHDTLTGLANRARFRVRVEQAVRQTSGDHRPAVLYLDLDEFKRVNDTLGHDYGDRLLRQVASRLELVVREGDLVGRLGGDEFAILIENAGDRSDHAAATAERVLDALRVPMQLGTQTVMVAASIGIATAEPGSTAATLLRDADTAMYQAKAAGRGRWALYLPEMRESALERLQIESDLPAAFDEQQFRLAYQPVVQLDTSKVRGFEALLRWDHPVLGPIPPDRFIPICEENGMIHRLGDWVLHTACATAAEWQAEGLDATISINVSARQLSSVPIVDQVRDVLVATGVRADSVVLEVTETALVDDQQMAAERLVQLRQLGVQLAIDDFGTGYSSLSYLRHFPVDILKIDGSFVQSINDPDAVPPIIPGLMGLGRALGLDVIAEGIENRVQRDWLIAEGCELGQGYLYAAPMSAEDAAHTLRHGTAVPLTTEDARRA